MVTTKLSSISLKEFRGQCHVFDVEDDWGRVSNPDTRRKLQNRLNQRACRLRKKKARKPAITSPGNNIAEPSAACSHFDHQDERLEIEPVDQMQIIRKECSNNYLMALHDWTTTGPWYTSRSTILLHFYELQLARYLSRSLSSSHLLSLLQVNVLKGFERILDILGVPPEKIVDDDAVSPFTNGTLESSVKIVTYFPESLSPSILQKTVPHHPWVDILPYPQMRDNVLLIKSREDAGVPVPEFDEEELCHWMVGLYPQQGEGGLVLWGEPWDPASWEASENFVRRWGWILKGCEDLMKSTNYWRRKRGESPLFRDG